MPRLTLARAVGWAPPINARARPHPTCLRIKLPGTRGTVLYDGTRNVLFFIYFLINTPCDVCVTYLCVT